MREALSLLAVAWHQEFGKEHVAVYATALSDVPGDELLAAVQHLVQSSKWRPSIAEIRRAVVDRRGVVPSAAVAAEQCELLDEWAAANEIPWGAQAAPEPRPVVHPTVDAAWTAAGHDALPAVFLKAWREARDEFVVDLVSRSLSAPGQIGTGLPGSGADSPGDGPRALGVADPEGLGCGED